MKAGVSKQATGSARLALTAGVLVAGLLGAVSVNADPTVDEVDTQKLKIYFLESDNCPKYVDDWEVEVSNTGKTKVKWVAYNIDGSKKLPTADYQIFFDPFKDGKPLDSQATGVIKSRALLHNVPTNVTFKYTVVGQKCLDHPLDPFVRIR